MRTATGNIWVISSVHISPRLPGKRKRLTAYPVVAATKTPITVESAEMITELANQLRNSVSRIRFV